MSKIAFIQRFNAMFIELATIDCDQISICNSYRWVCVCVYAVCVCVRVFLCVRVCSICITFIELFVLIEFRFLVRQINTKRGMWVGVRVEVERGRAVEERERERER